MRITITMTNKPIFKQDIQVYIFFFLAVILFFIGMFLTNVVIILGGIFMIVFMIYRELYEKGWEKVPYVVSSGEYVKMRKKKRKLEYAAIRKNRDEIFEKQRLEDLK